MQTTILVVDDNPLNLELARDLLDMEGFRVVCVECGREALGQAQTHKPKLILMDIRMPEVSGLDALRILRQHADTADIPVVALTASVMVGEKERLLDEGFDGFLQKPIEVTSFVDEVRDFLKV